MPEYALAGASFRTSVRNKECLIDCLENYLLSNKIAGILFNSGYFM